MKHELKLVNSLPEKSSEPKELFKPIQHGQVSMYVCGPTVYGPGHIGHARTYVAFDMIRRFLECLGNKVDYVVNITDVHDDMIKRAREQNTDIFSLGKKFTKLFFEDMAALHIKPATANPKVTEHIQDIIQLVSDLIKKGFAYDTDDGVYFSVDKFEHYGRLSGIKKTKQVTGTRVATDKYEKHAAQDFALWKKTKVGEEDVASWDAPFGKGRPGWHIECSVMSGKHLGHQIDIHGGAQDLKFPHHENEIAQSEAGFGKTPFVKYWLHSGFLNVDGEKMSKSLGNYIEIQDLLKKYSGKQFRFFVANIHYRSPMNFSWQLVEERSKALDSLNGLIQRLQSEKFESKPHVESVTFNLSQIREEFFNNLGDDFSFPNAWALVYSLEREINTLMPSNFTGKNAKDSLAFLKEVDSIFYVFDWEKEDVVLNEKEKQLLDQRASLRKEKKFDEADKIRDQLLALGLQLDDTKDGLKIRRIK